MNALDRKQKSNAPPKNMIGPITFAVVMLFVIYTTIASATLNAKLQISGDATFAVESTPAEEFDYSGSCEEYQIPESGLYKLEVWGAEGGGSTYRGKGGYSTGKVQLTQGTTIYICVGGAGKVNDGAITPGGFNGGGSAEKSDGNNGSGGGATDIRITTNSLYARIIVAGGGGGNIAAAGTSPLVNRAGHGGGISGLDGTNNYKANDNDLGYIATGGSATAGGTGITGVTGNYISGTFGQGGNGGNVNRAGGGGGWYGGGSTYIIGGGGSGFVFTAGVSTPGGYLLSSSYQLADAYTADGGSSFPSTDGKSSIIGKTGNGYAKITYLGNKILTGTIAYSPSNWTNGNVIATLTANGTVTNNGGLNTYQFSQNGEFAFQLTDGTKSGTSTAKVTWIDKTQPDSFGVTIANTTVDSISVQGATVDQGGSGIKGYQFSRDNGVTWTSIQANGTYQFTGLSLNTTYTLVMKAIDNAGNERISSSKAIILRTKTFYATATTHNNSAWTNPTDPYYYSGAYRYNTTATNIYGYDTSPTTNAGSPDGGWTTSITYTMQNIGTTNIYDATTGATTSLPVGAKITSARIYTSLGLNRQTGTLSLSVRATLNGHGLSWDTGKVSFSSAGTQNKAYDGYLTEANYPARGGSLSFVVWGAVTDRTLAGICAGRVHVNYLWGTFTAHWYDEV